MVHVGRSVLNIDHVVHVPDGPWKSISLDFPSYKGFDVILTVVDRFTKMTPFLLYTNTINNQEIIDLVIDEVF